MSACTLTCHVQVDEAYPYLFEGRLWFRPAIVRVPEQLPLSVQSINLFGYSIGPHLCLRLNDALRAVALTFMTLCGSLYTCIRFKNKCVLDPVYLFYFIDMSSRFADCEWAHTNTRARTGGVVSLEYDESPVGPYYEYVTMGSLVYKRGFLGQWGSRLFVSTQPAEEVCRRIWEVPAEQAEISFVDGGALRCPSFPQAPNTHTIPLHRVDLFKSQAH